MPEPPEVVNVNVLPNVTDDAEDIVNVAWAALLIVSVPAAYVIV